MPTRPPYSSTRGSSRGSARTERMGDDSWIGVEATALTEALLDMVLTPQTLGMVLSQPDMKGMTGDQLRAFLRDNVVYPAWVKRLQARRWPKNIRTAAAKAVWAAENAEARTDQEVDPDYVASLDETGRRALLAKILLGTDEAELAGAFREALGRPVTHAEIRSVLPPEVAARLSSV